MAKRFLESEQPVSKPYKILLHMARVGDDWKGKATCFDAHIEFKFSSLEQLAQQLRDACLVKEKQDSKTTEGMPS